MINKYNIFLLIMCVFLLISCSMDSKLYKNYNNTSIIISKNITQRELDNITLIDNNDELILKEYIFIDQYNITHNLTFNLNYSILNFYKNNPVDITKSDDEFYNSFFKFDKGQDVYEYILNYFRNNTDNDRELIMMLMYFISSIEYKYIDDFYYSYELLYLEYGVCSDKSLLMIEFLDILGYGTSLISFPDNNHLVVGIKCNLNQYDDYCFMDITNKFTYITDNNQLLIDNTTLTDNYKIIPINNGKEYNATLDYEKQYQYYIYYDEYVKVSNNITDIEELINELNVNNRQCLIGDDIYSVEKFDINSEFYNMYNKSIIFCYELIDIYTGLFNKTDKLWERYEYLKNELSYYNSYITFI
jgi:hypothetical protein